MGTSSPINHNFLELSILLLSLSKIKKLIDNFKKYNQTKNEKLSILNILNDLSKEEKSINKYTEKFEKLFIKEIHSLNRENFYRITLLELNKELKKYDLENKEKRNLNDNYNEFSQDNIEQYEPLSLIEELFIGNREVTRKCKFCKKESKNSKCNILILNFELNSSQNDININSLFKENNIEREIECSHCKKITKHIINKKIYFPKIFFIVVKNNNLNNKIIFQLHENINNEKYNLISFIMNKDKMFYKNDQKWYSYNIKDKISKEKIINDNDNNLLSYQKMNSPIIFIYQTDKDIKERMDKIMADIHIVNHDYANAIINYVKFKKEIENNKVYENIYLIQKSFFIDLEKIIEINYKELNLEDKEIKQTKEAIDSKIRKKGIDLMKMDELKIINDIEDITEDIDFINEEILKNLYIEQEEYKGKNVCLYKVSENIFQFKFKDNEVVNIINGKIRYKGGFSYIQFKNKDNNIQNDNNNININNEKEIGDIENIKKEETKNKITGSLLLYYEGLCLFYQEQNIILEKINNNITNGNEFNDYFILNKKWFNKLSKIFENEALYQNNDNIIESINRINNISKLENNILSEITENFQKRKNFLNNVNLFNVEYEDKSQDSIKYPNEFIIIEKKAFINILLNNFHLDLKDMLNNNIYKMILGEHYLFVEDNKNKNTFFICSSNNILFNVELILKYNDDKIFFNEIKNYIQNKNGLDFYLKERNINFNGNKTQIIFEKDNKEIGTIININYIKKQNINEKPVNDNKNVSKEEYNNLENKNIPINKEKEKNTITISNYIKPLFFSLLKIKELKNFFINNHSSISQKNNLSNLFLKLISNNQKDILSKIIIYIENKIKEFKKDISTNLNFKNIIDFVLTTLDNELNNYDKEREEFDYEDFDQDLVYRKFQSYYEQESIIQKLFYAHLQITSSYECCKLNKYICKLYKYIYLNIESKEKVTLNSLIHYWENKETTIQKFCKMCFLKDQKTLEKKKLNKYPEILIIILNNPNNITINFEQKIKLNDYEYNIITGIIKTQKENSENSFDIVFYNNSKLTIFQAGNNEIKELEEKKINPYALFCRKGNEIKKKVKDNINKEKDMSGKKQKRNHNKENNMKNIGSQNKNNKMMNNNNEINKDTNIHPNNNFNNIAQNNMKNMEQNNNIPNNMNNIFQNNNINNNFPNNINNNIQGNMNIQQNNINNIIQGNMNNNFQQNNMNNNFNNNMNVNQMNTNINMNNNYNNNINNINNNICNNNNINNFNNNYNNNNFNNNPQNFNNNNYNNINLQNFPNNNYNNAINNFPCQSVLINNNMFNNNINMNGMNMQISSPIIGKNIININNNSNNNNLPVSNPVNNINDPNSSKKDENEYVLYFNFSNGKQLYLNVNKFLVFSQVIIELKSKYSWMNALKIKNYTFKKKTLDYNKTVKDNGLSDLSEIDIIEEDN